MSTGVGVASHRETVMSLSSSVTAASSAKALPFKMLALVTMVMLVRAIIVPMNWVRVPRVAELPTRQNTLQA